MYRLWGQYFLVHNKEFFIADNVDVMSLFADQQKNLGIKPIIHLTLWRLTIVLRVPHLRAFFMYGCEALFVCLEPESVCSEYGVSNFLYRRFVLLVAPFRD